MSAEINDPYFEPTIGARPIPEPPTVSGIPDVCQICGHGHNEHTEDDHCTTWSESQMRYRALDTVWTSPTVSGESGSAIMTDIGTVELGGIEKMFALEAIEHYIKGQDVGTLAFLPSLLAKLRSRVMVPFESLSPESGGELGDLSKAKVYVDDESDIVILEDGRHLGASDLLPYLRAALSAPQANRRSAVNDLRHEFMPCTSASCTDKSEHCGYSWCGAPRNHSLHETSPQQTGSAPVATANMWIGPEQHRPPTGWVGPNEYAPPTGFIGIPVSGTAPTQAQKPEDEDEELIEECPGCGAEMGHYYGCLLRSEANHG